MLCTNIDPIHNCGKCTFSFTDLDILKKTNSLTIARAASTILWMDIFTDCRIENGALVKVTISCIGNIHVYTKYKNIVLNNYNAISISHKLLHTWYSIESNNIDKNCNEKISKTIEIMETSNSINRIRNETVKLAKYIEKVNLGDRVSDITVFPSVEVKTTCFKLSDTYLVSRLTAVALTGILGNIVEHTRYLNVSTTFIDLQTCYVAYSGELALSPNLKFTNCNIKSMKSVYSQYLNTWCKNNFTKCTEIKKIKKSIDVSNRSQDLNELYDNCINLLNALEH